MPFPRARRLALAATAAAAAAFACAIALSGCSAAPEHTAAPTPAASDDSAPIFASDEEALAAAVAAYEAYAQASAAVASDGGADPERIDEYVTDDFAVTAGEEFAALQKSGARLKGRITFDTTSVVERSEAGQIATVSIYLCRDVSQVRAITSDGSDVTPSDRLERVPSVADFVSSAAHSSTLLVNGIQQWSGDDFC